MSNKELIERLNDYINNTDDCALRKEAADALAAADKRIAELEKYGRVQDPLADRIAELERKLAVAREALRYAGDEPNLDRARRIADAALAQIGGEDA